MPAKEAWGLDFGQTALRLVKVARHKGGASIEDLYIQPIPCSPDAEDFKEKMEEALEQLLDEAPIGNQPVAVSLPAATLFRDFPLPAISTNKLEEIVSYEAKQQIPWPLEEVLWDFHQYRSDPDSPELSISLVCCRRDFVYDLLDLLDEFGLKVVSVQPGAVALVNFLFYDQPPEGTALVLDCGVRATEFLILNEGNFWLRSITVSGMDITKALMSKFNMSYEDAEELKHKMGESKQAERVFQVVTPVLRTLTGEVQRSLGYYKSLYRGAQIDTAICAGGTFMLQGVDQFVADDLGLPVSLIQEPNLLTVGADTDETLLNENKQTLGPAIGLALAGIGQGEVDINLLPPEIQQRHAVARKVPYAIAAVVLLIAMTIISLTSAQKRATRWSDLIDDMKGTDQKVTRATENLEGARKEHAPAENWNAAISQMALSRGDLSNATSIALDSLARLNANRREQLAEQLDRERVKLYNGLMDSEAVKQTIFAYEEVFENNPDELKRQKDFVSEQCKWRAKYISSRRRQLVVDQISALPAEEVWYRGKTESNKGQYLSPEAAETKLAEAGQDEEKRNQFNAMWEKYPLRVMDLTIEGFSVSKQDELRDVSGLAIDMQELAKTDSSDESAAGWKPEMRSVALMTITGSSPWQFTTNKLPVQKLVFRSREEIERMQGAGALAAGEGSGGFLRTWETVDEAIIKFKLQMRCAVDARFAELDVTPVVRTGETRGGGGATDRAAPPADGGAPDRGRGRGRGR